MASVLHLISPNADEQTRRVHQMLVDGWDPRLSAKHDRLDLAGTFAISTAVLRLRQEEADIFYAWGIPALAAAVLCRHQRIVFSPDRFAGPRALRWIRPLCSEAVHCLSARPSPSSGSPYSAESIPRYARSLHRVWIWSNPPRRDPVLKAALGLDENDFVLIAPGESTLQAGHDQAVWACGIMNVLDTAKQAAAVGPGIAGIRDGKPCQKASATEHGLPGGGTP